MGGEYHEVQNSLDPVFYIPACGLAHVNDVLLTGFECVGSTLYITRCNM